METAIAHCDYALSDVEAMLPKHYGDGLPENYESLLLVHDELEGLRSELEGLHVIVREAQKARMILAEVRRWRTNTGYTLQERMMHIGRATSDIALEGVENAENE